MTPFIASSAWIDFSFVHLVHFYTFCGTCKKHHLSVKLTTLYIKLQPLYGHSLYPFLYIFFSASVSICHTLYLFALARVSRTEAPIPLGALLHLPFQLLSLISNWLCSEFPPNKIRPDKCGLSHSAITHCKV